MGKINYYFRRAQKRDLEYIYILLSIGLDEVEKKYFPCTLNEVRDILISNKDYAYVVTDDVPNNIIAYGHMRTFDGKYKNPALGIMVSKYYRGLGLSKKLCMYMLCDMQRQGYREVMLKVNKENTKAQQLYKDLGFEFRKEDDLFLWMSRKL